MLRPWIFWLLALLCSPFAMSADTVVLKDKAAITGTILAEKRDSVAVDVGYTVLVMPRSSVATISKDDEISSPIKTSPGEKPRRRQSIRYGDQARHRIERRFYHVMARSQPERNVRDLVNNSGGGRSMRAQRPWLGIFHQRGRLSDDKFPVTEGETQLSVEVYHQRNDQLERKTYKQVRIGDEQV
jgi:hypothetical protein